MTIIGIDPSLTATGLCSDDHYAYTVTGTQGDARLNNIYQHVLAATNDAELAIIEDLPTHGLGAGKTGMAQGVTRLACLHTLTTYRLITPATLKKFATGRGNATKPDMRMACYQRAGLDLRDDNQTDAWWLRQLGLHLTCHPSRIQLPKTHLSALDKIGNLP